MSFSSALFSYLTSAEHVGPAVEISGASCDSRKLEAGWLFVCLRGERTNGSAFVHEAVKKKAAAVLIDRCDSDVVMRYRKDITFLVCHDVVKTLSRFASLQLLGSRPISIGITGSCGKTTTKEMIASILSTRGTVSRTPGNMNSTIGLPLSLINSDPDCDYAVYELGVDHPGEMELLSSTLCPELAVITNIGISHLENFRTRENIALEKSKILLPQTKGFIPADCQFADIIRRQGRNVESVSSPFSEVQFLGLDGLRLTLGRHSFVMKAVGMHNVQDAALAAAVAGQLGFDDGEIAQGLSMLEPMFGRSRVVRQGSVTVIEDCYNATLDSMKDAISTVSRLSWKKDKFIVLGDMKELGSESARAHEYVGSILCNAKCEHIFLYGEEMENAYRILCDNGLRGKSVYTPDFARLSECVRTTVSKGDLVLIKGSRAMAMERLFDTLREVG